MSNRTSIEWCDTTWNPVTGCTKVSAGCKNCYAERIFNRPYPGRKFTDVRCHEDRLAQPLSWKKRRAVFVNSMSDLFHEDVPDEFLYKVFRTMAITPQHIYIVLTKRPENMLSWCRHQLRIFQEDMGMGLSLPLPNVILGVSVEDQATANERIPLLLQTPAVCRLVSYEPALGPVDFTRIKLPPEPPGELKHINYPIEMDVLRKEVMGDLGIVHRMKHGVDWLIIGGESGPKARSFDLQWARDTIAQCKVTGVACFVKQLGYRASDPENGIAGAGLEVHADARALVSNRLQDRKGGNWHEWPEDLRVRETPELRLVHPSYPTQWTVMSPSDS